MPLSTKRFAAMAAWTILFAADPSAARPQDNMQPPSFVPFPTPDFHFADPSRDAEYWRLQREVERSSAVFREALYQARKALKQPAPAPGSSAWLQARAAVERAILARRPVRDAQRAMIDFVIRERPKLQPPETAHALDIWSVEEQSLRGSSDNLVHLLAVLAGIRIDQLPP